MSRSVLLDAVALALHEVSAGQVIAIATSGGPDSFALAVLATEAAQQRGLIPWLLHVHHGLQAPADGWARQVEKLAQRIGARFSMRRARVDEASGQGVEAAARHARYVALADMARETQARKVLLAHHQDDQVETILLRLFRGAGLSGVAGMQAQMEREGVLYVRPWLAIPRVQIVPVAQREARKLGLPLADDPTNVDPRYSRGVLRREILPAVARHWPGYRDTVVRFARLAGQAAQVLDQVADEDLAPLVVQRPPFAHTGGEATVLDRAQWRKLDEVRRALALRAWFRHHQLPMPTESNLANMCKQLAEASSDSQVLLKHGAHSIRVFRDYIVLSPEACPQSTQHVSVSLPDESTPSTIECVWRGEPSWNLPQFDGVLFFEPAEEGFDADWLMAQPLEIGWRRGGERMRVQAARPSRTLKNLYQEAGIPAWQRTRLPLVRRGGEVIYAAGVGMSADPPKSRPGIALRWQPNRAGFAVETATASRPNDKRPSNAG